MVRIHCISLDKIQCFKAYLSGHQEMFVIILWCVHCKQFLYTCISQSNGKLFDVPIFFFTEKGNKGTEKATDDFHYEKFKKQMRRF